KDENMERQIEILLKKMTLDEKVGQMCELTIDLLQKRTNPFADIDPQNMKVNDLKKILEKYKLENEFKLGDEMPAQDVMMQIYMRIMGIESAKGFVLDEAMLDSVIGKYKVGSILNVPNSIAQTPAKWQEIIKRIQEKSMEVIGIPCIYGVDQIHGTTYTLGGTFFPQGINMAATFNRELTREGARISAYETKAGSIPWTYAPVTDLGRDPRWPRMWESYGEDCYLNAEMGREAVLGFQGNNPNHVDENHVAACMKHYMGYGVPVSGKDRTPSSITLQDMREKHFAPYLEMVKGGALSVMVNSAMNNGLPFHANYELLTKWLKEDLNWDGLIVTDWADINNLYSRDHIAKDKKEAIKLAINAGIDMSMDPYDWKFCTLLKELVQEGEVPMSRIDDAVRRVLRLKFRLNLFEKPYNDLKDYPLFGGAEHAAVALKAAEESMILLKNAKNMLPLAKGKKLLITGPNANSMRTLNGGWSYSWQGDKADECAAGYNTILEAFTNKFGSDNIIYEAGVTYKKGGNWWDENAPEIEKAVIAASGVDYIVACIGENSYCETPGNLTNLFLSENQLNLVKELAKTGKPIILILNEGRPRLIADIEPLAKAVINIMLPGNYGGDALANLIAGDTNFSGKMPYTYPKEINSLVTYDHKPSEHIGRQMEGAYNYNAVVNVQWAFGYGLSYTTFTYSNLKV
ncbi:glycoside hydrolase family 3 C-terminal domain-containing protein, partial [Bacteroides sp. OttesenSCG-928-D19]|nr:glycoside hydrolase family 3 C-terminal domain-containing protein [Bacteroides sp. OttesenSCG-928-D19]